MKFKPGAVIRTYEVKGRKVVFRWPRLSDARDLMKYRNSLVSERPPVLPITKPDMTLEKEKKYLKKIFKAMKKNTAAMLIIEVDGKFAASLHAKKTDPNSSILNHIVEIGLGLYKEFRGMGLGHAIMEMLEHVSTKHLKAQIIMLWVFGYNKKARSLYRKHGYKETGKIPKGIKYKGKYYNDMLMCKVLI